MYRANLYSIHFHIQEYLFRSVNGTVSTSVKMKGVLSELVIAVPLALSSDYIPDTREEKATAAMALAHTHTAEVAHIFPPYDPNARVQLLIDRTCLKALSSVSQSHKEPHF